MTRDTAERARELRSRLDQYIDREGEWDTAFHADAEILTTLTQIQAEARLEEAEWWSQRYHLDHSRGCTFDVTSGPQGDYCTCNLAERKREASKRIAALAQALQLEEKEEE